MLFWLKQRVVSTSKIMTITYNTPKLGILSKGHITHCFLNENQNNRRCWLVVNLFWQSWRLEKEGYTTLSICRGSCRHKISLFDSMARAPHCVCQCASVPTHHNVAKKVWFKPYQFVFATKLADLSLKALPVLGCCVCLCVHLYQFTKT